MPVYVCIMVCWGEVRYCAEACIKTPSHLLFITRRPGHQTYSKAELEDLDCPVLKPPSDATYFFPQDIARLFDHFLPGEHSQLLKWILGIHFCFNLFVAFVELLQGST